MRLRDEGLDGDIYDIPRLKREVIEMWCAGKGDTLVKVVPRGCMPNGPFVGYCTTIKFLISHTPKGMELLLGFRAVGEDTRLLHGADIYLVDPLPAPYQFAFRGYSHTPAGVPQLEGRVIDPEFPPGRGVPQWELDLLPRSALRFLASVMPGETFRYMYSDLPPAPRAVFV